MAGDNILTEAKRRAMIDLAIGIVAEGGLGALTFRSLAAAAGTSTAPFTTEFGSRENMLEKVIAVVWRRLGIQEGEEDSDDPLETLQVVEGGDVRAVLTNAQTGGAETQRVEDAAAFLAAFPLLELADATTSRAYRSPLLAHGRAPS